MHITRHTYGPVVVGEKRTGSHSGLGHGAAHHEQCNGGVPARSSPRHGDRSPPMPRDRKRRRYVLYYLREIHIPVYASAHIQTHGSKWTDFWRWLLRLRVGTAKWKKYCVAFPSCEHAPAWAVDNCRSTCKFFDYDPSKSYCQSDFGGICCCLKWWCHWT